MRLFSNTERVSYASCATYLFLPHLTSSVIYYWIRRTATWNLFVLYNNEKPFLFQNIIQHNAKAGILPRLCPAFILLEKSHLTWSDGFKMKQFHWLLCVAKNRNWSRKIAPLSNLTRASLLVEWKLTAKAELNCEIYKSWRKCWKNQVSFCHRSSPVSEKLGRCPWKLQELKTTLGKLVVTVNLEAIWFGFWMKGA